MLLNLVPELLQTACMDSLMDSLVQLQAGLAMNGIFEVLGENKKYIEFYNTARERARGDTRSLARTNVA